MEITGINLNGLDLMTADYAFDISGLFDVDKDIEDSDMFIDGSAFGRSKVNKKPLTMNGMIPSGDPKLIAAFNRAISGNGLKPLIVTIKDIGQLICQVELQNRGSTEDSRFVSCQLVMLDPYLYALEPQSIQLGSTYSTGVIFGPGHGVIFGPGHGVVFGSATGESGTLTNSGNADVYPVITVVGTCSGIGIRNLTTGEQIDISEALGDADTLVIDCRPTTCGVYLNGVPHIEYKTSPGWIHCPPGDNQFSFSRSSLQNKKHCTVELQSRWM